MKKIAVAAIVLTAVAAVSGLIAKGKLIIAEVSKFFRRKGVRI